MDAKKIERSSVVCDSCNMDALLDEHGNCEFCRRAKGDPLEARRAVRHGESQKLLTFLVIVGVGAVVIWFLGLTVFLVASNVVWLLNSGYWYRKAKVAEEWPNEIEGK